jgi:hypothetical protein
MIEELKTQVLSVYFVARPLPLLLAPPEDVILLVCMSSPIYLHNESQHGTTYASRNNGTYDWRNLFPPSSFSCSAFTDSTRSTMSNKLACSAFA